jgi:hypothetical protein
MRILGCFWIVAVFCLALVVTPLLSANCNPPIAGYIHNAANTELQRAAALFAQKSDGSPVLFQKTVGPGVSSGTRRILDVQNKRVISIDPRTKSISTFHYSDKEWDHARNPPLSCESHGNPLAQDPQPQQKIEGLEVIRFSRKMASSENPIVRWLSPALNCLCSRTKEQSSPTSLSFDGQRRRSCLASLTHRCLRFPPTIRPRGHHRGCSGRSKPGGLLARCDSQPYGTGSRQTGAMSKGWPGVYAPAI